MYSNNYGRRSLFDSQDFHEYHAGVVEGLKRRIDGLSLEELQSEKKREAMVAGATRVVPTIDWTKLEITKKAEQTRYSDDRFFGRQAYKVTVCTFEVPFTGDWGMFSISPTQRRLSHDEADVNHDGILSFELTASEDAEQSKAALKRMQNNIDTNLNNLRNDIAGHNAGLEGVVNDLFDRRIAELDKHASQADSFGVPMRAETE